RTVDRLTGSTRSGDQHARKGHRRFVSAGQGLTLIGAVSVERAAFDDRIGKIAVDRAADRSLVVLEDDVEVGSGCVIERGTLDNTVIGKGSKVGDAVAIGHGTKIGPHCLLVPQAGIAGTAELGHHCVIGGQVGVVGHIKVGNMVKVGAQAGVINNVPDGATIVGSPAIDANKAKRAYALIETLPDMRKKLRTLDKEVKRLKDTQE
ncbi:MAG: hypothetical protein ABFR90_11010, partial [Planctomycetota bacterium]